MILDMQVDPEEYPDSASGQDQDQAWLIDPENFYSTCRLFTTFVLNKDMPRIIMQDGNIL